MPIAVGMVETRLSPLWKLELRSKLAQLTLVGYEKIGGAHDCRGDVSGGLACSVAGVESAKRVNGGESTQPPTSLPVPREPPDVLPIRYTRSHGSVPYVTRTASIHQKLIL